MGLFGESTLEFLMELENYNEIYTIFLRFNLWSDYLWFN